MSILRTHENNHLDYVVAVQNFNELNGIINPKKWLHQLQKPRYHPHPKQEVDGGHLVFNQAFYMIGSWRCATGELYALLSPGVVVPMTKFMLDSVGRQAVKDAFGNPAIESFLPGLKRQEEEMFELETFYRLPSNNEPIPSELLSPMDLKGTPAGRLLYLSSCQKTTTEEQEESQLRTFYRISSKNELKPAPTGFLTVSDLGVTAGGRRTSGHQEMRDSMWFQSDERRADASPEESFARPGVHGFVDALRACFGLSNERSN